MDVRVGKGRRGGKSNQRKWELRTVPKQGTDAWGWSGYLSHKDMSGLDAEMKDKRNVGGK